MTFEPPAPSGAPGSGWAPQPPPPPPPPAPPGWPALHPPGDWTAPGWAPPRRNGAGVASLFVGLLSLPLSLFWIVGLPVAVTALVLGLVGRGRVKRGEADAMGPATAGVVFGSAGIVLCVVVFAWVAVNMERTQRKYEACLARGEGRVVCVNRYKPARP